VLSFDWGPPPPFFSVRLSVFLLPAKLTYTAQKLWYPTLHTILTLQSSHNREKKLRWRLEQFQAKSDNKPGLLKNILIFRKRGPGM
jgi:hypothetical protein